MPYYAFGLFYDAYLWFIYTDHRLRLVTVPDCGYGCFVGIFVRWNKVRSYSYGKQSQEAQGKMTQWLQQVFGGAKKIKILKREQYFVDNYASYYGTFIKVQKIFSFINQIPHLILECFCVVVILLLITVRLQAGVDVNTFVPQLSVFAMALFRLFPRISMINGCLNQIIFNYPYMCRDLEMKSRKCEDVFGVFYQKRPIITLEQETDYKIFLKLCIEIPEHGISVENEVKLNKEDGVLTYNMANGGNEILLMITALIMNAVEPLRGIRESSSANNVKEQIREQIRKSENM